LIKRSRLAIELSFLLRRKLSTLAPDRELVHSVYGVGYRFEDRE